jgi:hypothetical protein
MTTPGLGVATIQLVPLTLVDDGPDVLVGHAESGTFVSMPPVGAVLIRALQRGADLAVAAAEAQAFAGEPVDAAAFVEALHGLGFVRTGEPAPDPEPAVARTAPVQQRRWVAGLIPELAHPLFTPAAWAGYAAALLFSVATFALDPGRWPRSSDLLLVGGFGTSVLILLPFGLALTALHEAWHWLAMRAIGLRTRFGVDRRAWFLTFETDLSQLWTVPRRARYGPELAGMAIDAVVIAALLAAELAGVRGAAGRMVAALVYLKVAAFCFQLLVFLRTDLYAVLVTAAGCRNLWQVKSLLLRGAFGRLTPDQRRILAAADPRDLRTGRWFRWLYLAGMLALAGYFSAFVLPVLWGVARWTAAGLTAGPGQATFWWTTAVTVIIWYPVAAAAAIAIAARTRHHRHGADAAVLPGSPASESQLRWGAP